MRAHGHRDARFVADLDALVEVVASEAQAGDLVLTCGAGSIAALGAQLLAALGDSAT